MPDGPYQMSYFWQVSWIYSTYQLCLKRKRLKKVKGMAEIKAERAATSHPIILTHRHIRDRCLHHVSCIDLYRWALYSNYLKKTLWPTPWSWFSTLRTTFFSMIDTSSLHTDMASQVATTPVLRHPCPSAVHHPLLSTERLELLTSNTTSPSQRSYSSLPYSMR